MGGVPRGTRIASSALLASLFFTDPQDRDVRLTVEATLDIHSGDILLRLLRSEPSHPDASNPIIFFHPEPSIYFPDDS